jgi:chromosome partitioning protein
MSVPLIIAVACRKGGVGKTTTAVGIASWLAQLGKKTAIIELDDQGNAGFALGCDLKLPGSAELLLGKSVAPQEANGVPNLVVYVGSTELLNAGIAELDAEHLRDVALALPFDAIVIDCPPKSDNLERMGLVAASVCLIPLIAHPFAVAGAQRIASIIQARVERGRAAPHRVALVATRIDPRKRLDKELFPELQSMFPNAAVHTVRTDEQVAIAMAEQRSFVVAYPKSRGTQDYQTIVTWILEGSA